MCYTKYGKLSITDETVIMQQARLNQWWLEATGRSTPRPEAPGSEPATKCHKNMIRPPQLSFRNQSESVRKSAIPKENDNEL